MRASGILLPVSSLPSEYGIGCFSKSAYEFVDQLKKAGQKYWQILPLGPTSYGDSPYQSFSTFAGNPYFISLEDLIEEGVLTKKECDEADFGDDPRTVDYGKLYKERFRLLRKAYERSDISKNPAFCTFMEQNGYWVRDYALFMAIKDFFQGSSWNEWPEDIRKRWDYAMEYYQRTLYYEIEFYEYVQFKFFEQWYRLKAYANEKNIKIIGDIPIYVAFDSADTWANPDLFQLDESGMPTLRQTAKFGETLCTAGIIMNPRSFLGGSAVFKRVFISMMWSESIIFEDSMNIFLFHMEKRQRIMVIGRKVQA